MFTLLSSHEEQRSGIAVINSVAVERRKYMKTLEKKLEKHIDLLIERYPFLEKCR